jgi:hypothetical protein
VTASGLASGVYADAYFFTNAINSFTGDGGGLSGLNASNLSSGTLDDARLSANVARYSVIATPGTINQAGNPLHWTKLKGVPVGLADGTDNVSDRAGAPSGNLITTLDTPGSHSPGVTVGADGLGLIAYGGGGDLHVAHCENPGCSSATTTTFATPGIVDGSGPAVAVGSDGFGLITHGDFTNKALKVTHCENAACTSSTTSSFDVGAGGGPTSVTIGTDGFALISYWQGTPNTMKIAHCTNVPCTAATTMTLDPGVAGDYNSIAIGADGLGLISYRTGSGLKVAHCQNTACSSVTAAIVDAPFQGNGNSLTIGDDGLGLISYTASTGGASNGWRVAHCQNLECSSVTATTFDVGTSVGETSITIGADGLGVIAYRDFAFNLKVAHCQNPACSAISGTTVTSGGFSTFPALTLGADGLPLIAFAGGPTNNDQLKVVHCSNAFCVPFFRRR